MTTLERGEQSIPESSLTFSGSITDNFDACCKPKRVADVYQLEGLDQEFRYRYVDGDDTIHELSDYINTRITAIMLNGLDNPPGTEPSTIRAALEGEETVPATRRDDIRATLVGQMEFDALTDAYVSRETVRRHLNGHLDVSTSRGGFETFEEFEEALDAYAHQYQDFVDAHRELTSLERKRGRLENQLEEITNEIEEIEGLNQKRRAATDRREEITEDLEELRGRIDQLEMDLVETLNSIMEDLIARLGYDNIARVWLERQTTADSRASSFELHVVRETEDGSVYDDSVETLSESEREIVGLVVSLAGYLVHDVDQEVPFLILDSVEMIDGKRLAELLQYIRSETDVEFLSVALLPKDARAVQETGLLDDSAVLDFDMGAD